MCGILGLYSAADNLNEVAVRVNLQRGLQRLHHRGPDGQGIHVIPAHGVALAHTRLSIIDLDPRADQPMSTSDQKNWITFNGEIYNYQELRKELMIAGVTFVTASDTEVLLKGYQHWGIDRLLKKIVGMFAFAIFDVDRQMLILARDRFAKKPLYYYQHEGVFYFASELAALLELLPIRPPLSGEGLAAFLTLKFSPPTSHLLTGVQSVPAAQYFFLDNKNTIQAKTYWTPYQHYLAGTESPLSIEALLIQAVRRRLVSDVPICLFLSGGIDSSLLAAMASANHNQPLRSYCIGYKDHPKDNEFEYAQMVADRYQLDHEAVYIDDRQVMDILSDDASVLDEPIADWVWVPLYYLSDKAHREGYKVTLVGEGADEVFFGYNSMMKQLRLLGRQQGSFAHGLASFGHYMLGWLGRYSNRGHRRWDLWRRHVQHEPLYMGSSFGIPQTLFGRVLGQRYHGDTNTNLGYEYIKTLQQSQQNLLGKVPDLVSLISYVEIFAKMSEILLKRVDRISMLNSLEARSPFLDQDLVEKVFCLPGMSRISNQSKKALLKDFAYGYLPKDIIDRPKMGFSFPFKQWLHQDMGKLVRHQFETSRIFSEGWLNRDYCLAILNGHVRGIRDEAPRIWMMYSLARWYDRWVS